MCSVKIRKLRRVLALRDLDKEGLELYVALDTGRGGVLGSRGAPVSN